MSNIVADTIILNPDTGSDESPHEDIERIEGEPECVIEIEHQGEIGDSRKTASAKLSPFTWLKKNANPLSKKHIYVIGN